MAKHEINLTDAQEKSLSILTAEFNAPLLLQVPPGTTRTEDEYLMEFVLVQTLESMVAQAGTLTETPILAELKKAIASGDDAKVQAVKDALGVAKVDAVAAVAVK